MTKIYIHTLIHSDYNINYDRVFIYNTTINAFLVLDLALKIYENCRAYNFWLSKFRL